MIDEELKGLLARAKAQVSNMTPEQLGQMLQAQRESYMRSIRDWPKPRYHYENGVKVYESYEDYCNN